MLLAPAQASSASDAGLDVAIELAMRIEPDGGMPGATDEDRLVATMVALLALLQQPGKGFQAHIERLVEFLEHGCPPGMEANKLDFVRAVIASVRRGNGMDGDWQRFAGRLAQEGRVDAAAFWRHINDRLTPD